MRATSSAFSLVELEARRGRGRALDEERDGLVVEQLVRRQRPLGIGDVERGDAEDDLARARAAARGSSRGSSAAAPRGAARPRALRVAASTCSQLSSTSSSVARREEVDHARRPSSCAGQRPHVERGGDGVRDEPRVGDGGELDERGAARVRRLGRRARARARAASSRRRPCPASVSSRVRPSSDSQLGELAARGRRTSSRPPAAPNGAVAGPSAASSSASSAASSASSSRRVLGPVVVAVLRAAARRRRARARRGRPPASSSRRASAAASSNRSTSTSTSPRATSTSSRTSIASGAERAPRDVHRLVEVVRGRGRRAVAPEHVHRLLAVEPVAAGEREQLHELARLLQAPRAVGHDDAVDRRREAAEQLDADSHRTNLTRGTRVAASSRSSLSRGKAFAKRRFLASFAQGQLTRLEGRDMLNIKVLGALVACALIVAAPSLAHGGPVVGHPLAKGTMQATTINATGRDR